jgi:6-pyruvoyltetrahydropterin/6-carboxytetrahydropterin synthase
MIRVTRRFRFAASHRLNSEVLSAERNREVYGKCNNPYGHGHDYIVEVSVRGPVDPETGLAVRVEALDALMREEVLQAFHMRNLNLDVAEFADLVPTSENLALVIRARLQAAWGRWFGGPWPVLEKVRIQETPRNSFEVFSRTSESEERDQNREMATK